MNIFLLSLLKIIDNHLKSGLFKQFLIIFLTMLKKFVKIFIVVPHVTDAIMEWVSRVAKIPVDGDDEEPEVCIIEVKAFLESIFYFLILHSTIFFLLNFMLFRRLF